MIWEDVAMTGKQQAQRGAYEWVQTLVYVVLAVVLLFTFVGRLSRVQGESMRETLQDRDLLLVLNGYLCGSYEAGDIVIAQRGDFNDGAPIVKRNGLCGRRRAGGALCQVGNLAGGGGGIPLDRSGGVPLPDGG